jgi:AcrR family transcriptional regulator
VVEAGLAVVRREGLDAVTMRRVAKELDTGAASLYVYVGGRDELLRLLFDEVVGTVRFEEPDPARWREQLRDLCVALLEALEAYPGVARVALAEIPTGPNAMACAEALMGMLLAGGVDPRRAAWAVDVLGLLVAANAVETVHEQARAAKGATPFDQAAMRRVLEELPADRYPSLTCHVDELTAGDTRERFLFAVDTFVDGLLR